MNSQQVYLDYNATARIRPEVIDIVARVMSEVGNASSVHEPGRKARVLVEDARAAVAALVGAKADNVIFTGGGTEADNLALKGVGDRRLMVSAVEHGAVLAPAMLRDAGAVILPVDGDGLVRAETLEAALAAADKPALVSVMLANNETGVIEPVAELAEIAHRHGALVHCDGVQAAGKIPVDINALGVDMMSLSAHKIGGPQGIGVLVLREDMTIEAEIVGGGQERGRRSGTENVAGAAGYGRAAELALQGLERHAALATLRDDMERRLGEIAHQRRVFGERVPRLPNTSCVSMPGVRSDVQVMAFDLAGVAISAGAACSSGKVAASHVLEAMGIDEDAATCAIRVSLGWASRAADVDRFVDVWREIHARRDATADAA